MSKAVPNDWTECEIYRGWIIAVKHYKTACYKAFKAGAETASYSSRADCRLAVDATEDAFV